jgi:hypothetical protein
VQIESTRTIEIDQFVPRSEIDDRYIDSPYYVAPDGKVGQDAFAVIRDTIAKMELVALGRVVLTRREHIIDLEARGRGLVGLTLRLLDERDGRFGFRDLASARQIAKAAQRRGSPLGNHPRRQRNPAVLVAPDYIDAMFNLALLLQRNGAFAEAADYWRRYLAHDRASECAARARRSLKFCEIQVKFLACASGSADSDKAA